jgi:hypothetical protein
MSIFQNYYVGPFARWLMPEGQNPGLPPEDYGDGLIDRTMRSVAGYDYRAADGNCYHPYFFVPLYEVQSPQGRELSFSQDLPNCQDLTDVDRGQEVEWFAATYAAELGALAIFFGSKPLIRWGIVYWFS